MKRIITLLAALAIASAAHAQTDSLVVFDTQGDNLGISLAGFNITLGETGDATEAIKPRPKRVTTNFAGISWGGSVLSYKPNYGNWAEERNFITDNTGSMRFGIEAMGIKVSLDRNRNVIFKAALNTTCDFFYFRDAMTLINDENGVLMPVGITGPVKKSVLVAGYAGLGVGLGFRISKVMINMDFSTDIGGSPYVKYKNPKKTKYYISGINNIRYRTGVSVTLHGIGIYADYSLTPLFREGVGNDGHIISIGGCFGF